MKKSIKKNYIYNLVYQIVMLITPLITAPYISRVLGPGGVGINSYTSSVVSYFTLVAVLGSADYGQREIAYRQDDIYLRTAKFWEVFILRFSSSVISLIAFLFVVEYTEYRILFLIQSLNIIAVAFDVTWFFQGMEEFGKIVLRNVLVRVINIVVIFLFVKNYDDVNIYIASIAVTALVGHFSIGLYLPRYLCKISINILHPYRNIKGVAQLFIPQIAIQISAVLDKTMLTVLTGTVVENGFYESADRIEKICLTIVSSLSIVMVPRISYIYAQKNLEKLRYYINHSYRFIWMLSIPMMVGMFLSADLFVPWFFGSGFEPVINLIRIFSVLLCLVGLSGVTGGQYFIPTGKQKEYTFSVIAGMVVNVCLNFVLIPHYLSYGAAIATVVGEFTVTMVQFALVKEIFPLRENLRYASKYAIASGVMGVILIICKRTVLPTIAGTLYIIFMGGTVYIIELILMKDELIYEVLNKFLRKE